MNHLPVIIANFKSAT